MCVCGSMRAHVHRACVFMHVGCVCFAPYHVNSSPLILELSPRAAIAFPSFLSSPSFLFTFGLSNSVGISLWTVKIQYLPRASRRAKSEVTNRSEGMFASVFLFLRARGQCGHPLNSHCASNPWSSLLTGGRGDTIIQNKVPSFPDLIWQRMTVKSHEFNPIRKEASLD